MMKVTIENYTEHCLKTWGGENQKERAELGIIGELGEVAEVLKKFLRGDFDEVERDKRLLKELGDVTYYIAIDLHLHNHGFNYIYEVAMRDVVISSDLFGLVGECVVYQDSPHDEWDAIGHIGSLVDVIEGFGFTLEQVMQANIEKLQDRAKRDKIKGDGDFR